MNNSNNRIIYISWIVLTLAVLAWCEVGYFVYTVALQQSAYVAMLSVLGNTSAQQKHADTIAALADATASSRSSLQSFMQVDPVALAGLIQSGASAIGTPIQLGNAIPQTLSSKVGLSAFTFTGQAQGAFPSVMRAAEMLEQLPVPASVQAMNISLTPAQTGQASSWQLQVQMRVFTSSVISS